MTRYRLFLLVALAAITVYAVSIPSHPSVDSGLSFLNAAIGAAATPPQSAPLWSAALAGLGIAFSGPSLAAAARLLSIVCAGFACGLVAVLVAAIPRTHTAGEPNLMGRAAERGLSPALLRFVSGALAGLFLAFCPAFFLAASTTAPYAFDLLLLALVAALVVRSRTARSPVATLTAAAFLTGLGVAQSATMMLVAPLFLLMALAGMTRQGRIRWGWFASPVVAALAGIALGYAITLLFWVEPLRAGAFPGRTLGSALVDNWRVQWMQLKLRFHHLPAVLMTVVAVFIPAAYLFLVPKNPDAGPRRRFLGFLLGLLLTAISVTVLLELTPLSPDVAYAGYVASTVPYAVTCATLGYIAGVWILGAWGGVPRLPRPLRRFVRVLVCLMVSALPAYFAIAGWHVRAKARRTLVPAAVQAAVSRLDPDTAVLLAGDPIDRLVRFYLAARPDPVEVVDISRVGLPDRQRFYRGRFPGLATAQGKITRDVVTRAAWEEHGAALRTFAAAPLQQLGAGFHALGCWFVPGPGPVDERIEERVGPVARQCTDFSTSPRDTWARFGAFYSRLINDAGVVALRADRPERAGALFDIAVEAYPDNISATMNKAYLFAARNDYETATATLEGTRAILERGAAVSSLDWITSHHGLIHSPDAYAHLGLARAVRGEDEPAIADLEQALALDPGQERLEVLLARLKLRRGDLAEAEATLRRLLDRDPANPDAREALALLRLQQGRLDEAEATLADLTSAGEARPGAIAALALVRIRRGDVEGAARSLHGLRGSVAGDPQILVARAYVAALEDRRYEASELLRQAEAAAAADPDVLLLATAVHEVLDDTDQVEALLLQAIEADPSHAPSLARLVLLRMGQSRLADAAETAERLLAVQPDHWLGLLVDGTVALRDGDMEIAADRFARSVENRPTPLGLNNLAWSLDQLERYEEALAAARRGLEIAPGYPDLLDTLGWLEYRAGDRERARELLGRAIDTDPRHPHAHLHLGLILEAEGGGPTAAGHLEIARDAGISEAETADARRALDRPTGPR